MVVMTVVKKVTGSDRDDGDKLVRVMAGNGGDSDDW